MFEEYRAYLADNPKGYWFKRKMYGFGWTPARWQGWLLTGVFLLFVFGLVILSSSQYALITPDEILWPILGATLLFVVITWRTGEPPKWQWGIKKKNEQRN